MRASPSPPSIFAPVCPSVPRSPFAVTACGSFLDRLISIAIPRIRDFRGISPKSFDGRGNFSMGVTEQLIFPEIDFDKVITPVAWTSPS